MHKFYTYLFSVFFCASYSFGQNSAIKNIINGNFPSSLKALTKEDGTPLSIGNGLESRYVETQFSGSKYLIVLYQAWTSSTGVDCEVKLIQENGTSGSVAQSLNDKFPAQFSNCTDIDAMDLDGDGIPEIIVTTSDSRGHSEAPSILKWNGKSLSDITPTATYQNSVGNAFNHVELVKIGNKYLLIDKKTNDQGDITAVAAYRLSNSTFSNTGSFDGLEIFEKKTNRPAKQTISKITFNDAGTYTLEAKQLSGKRSVRAEIMLDDSVVLKPQDFCSGPQPAKSDKSAWAGTDDADDKDEDHMKRCPAKKDVYAIVKVKQDSVLKVKVYGAGGSQLQVTLKKK